MRVQYTYSQSQMLAYTTVELISSSSGPLGQSIQPTASIGKTGLNEIVQVRSHPPSKYEDLELN
jgi:hypothetical protein